MSKRFVLLTTAAFAVFGPPIGVLYAFGWAFVTAAASGSVPSFGSFELRFLSAIFIVAWLMAGIPAAVAGMVWAVAMRRLARTRRPSLPLRALWGALVGGVAGAALSLVEPRMADPLMFPKCGAVAAAVLAVCFPRRGWLDSAASNLDAQAPPRRRV